MNRRMIIPTIRIAPPPTTLQTDRCTNANHAMSATEKLSLLTTEIKKHLGIQKMLNEIILQSGNSTVQLLIQTSDESLSTLENEIEKLTSIDVVNVPVVPSEAGSSASTSSSRPSSRLLEKMNPKARRSFSAGDDSINLCAICLDKVADVESHARAKPMTVKGCGHIFHDSCLSGWLIVQKTCPTCRNTVPVR